MFAFFVKEYQDKKITMSGPQIDYYLASARIDKLFYLFSILLRHAMQPKVP